MVFEGATYNVLPAEREKVLRILEKAHKKRVRKSREYSAEEKAAITARMNQLREIRNSKRAAKTETA